jgi:hypothetical protein
MLPFSSSSKSHARRTAEPNHNSATLNSGNSSAPSRGHWALTARRLTTGKNTVSREDAPHFSNGIRSRFRLEQLGAYAEALRGTRSRPRGDSRASARRLMICTSTICDGKPVPGGWMRASRSRRSSDGSGITTSARRAPISPRAAAGMRTRCAPLSRRRGDCRSSASLMDRNLRKVAIAWLSARLAERCRQEPCIDTITEGQAAGGKGRKRKATKKR